MSHAAPTTLHNFIGGRHVPPSTGAWIDKHDPASGHLLARVPRSSEADVNAAVDAANQAFPAWAALSASARAAHLLRLADLIDAQTAELAQAESRDTGKPITLARSVDIPRSAANLRYFAHAVQHAPGEMHEYDGAGVQGSRPAINLTLRRPRGVAGLITPWNLPLYLLTWKIAPALATGNTVVAKPSEVTPSTAAMLGCLAEQAGLPPGVLNLVHGLGPEAGGALVTHPQVPAVSFTGSTAVGRWIGQHAGGMLKRVSLELGGKNPFVIFADADLPAAAATAVRAAFTNQGQICLCGSRLLVHESVADQVIAEIVRLAGNLTIGDPLDPATQFGALTSTPHFQKVAGLVNLARELGGRILCGGSPIPPDRLPPRCAAGCFYPPTVITGLDPSCRVEQEEIFGPVLTVQRFSTEEQALALANGTPYGLAATIFTGDVTRAHRFASQVQAGIVWVNCWMTRDLRTPFGGAKASGVGREGGSEALRFFTEPKNVCIGL